MKQFCKLCIITAFYILFWIPNAFHLSWNLTEPLNNGFLSLSNILYLIPYLLTPIIGLFVIEEEAVLVFLGGILASLLQFGIGSADTLTSFQHYWNQPFTYFPHLFTMFIQIIYVGITIILCSKFSKFNKQEAQTSEDDNLVNDELGNDNLENDDLKSEEIVAATN